MSISVALKILKLLNKGRRMTDKRLKTFQAVAETNSFTKAAELVHLTQPAVTFQVKCLEEELGMQVFLRVRNRIEITEAGKIALKCAEAVQDAYAKMYEAIAKLQSMPKPQGWKPSTQAEADILHAKYCTSCTKRPKTFGVACEIWRAAEMYPKTDIKYPTEWQCDAEGKPVCTGYQAQ